MAVTSVGSATQTAIINTEHILDTEANPGVYVLVVDTSNLALGDVLELRIKTKAAAGGTSRLAYSQTYAHAQAEPNKYSVPVPVDTEIICTLKQIAGTGRDFLWNLLVM
jgi:hypothetical protein